MSARKKMSMGQVHDLEELPSILASLSLRKKPNFVDLLDDDIHRIHWALHILKYTGFEAVARFGFNRYFCGPYSRTLEDILEKMNWRSVSSAGVIDDDRLLVVREAIEKGDDFLLALSLAVGIADHNDGCSKGDVSKAISFIMPDLGYVAEAACDFAEVRIWPK